MKGPRGPLKGPRGPFKGPRDPFKGTRGPFKGTRGPFKGPRDPFKGPRNLHRSVHFNWAPCVVGSVSLFFLFCRLGCSYSLKGSRGPLKGPRGPLKGPCARAKPAQVKLWKLRPGHRTSSGLVAVEVGASQKYAPPPAQKDPPRPKRTPGTFKRGRFSCVLARKSTPGSP